jgi:hypothetical protein
VGGGADTEIIHNLFYFKNRVTKSCCKSDSAGDCNCMDTNTTVTHSRNSITRPNLLVLFNFV